MLRFSFVFRRSVPYASLFTYNHVLQRVFETPGDKIAFVREVPGAATEQYTYGQVQRDVIATANVLVERQEVLSRRRGDASLAWLQPRRPDHVRSLFAQGERTASCDYLQDTGYYTSAILSGPGYTFVVSMLAGWSVNQLMVPMSMYQKYNDELMYVLEHSGCRSIIGQGSTMEEKLPAVYRRVWASSRASLQTLPPTNTTVQDGEGGTYQVETVVDLSSLLEEMRTGSHTYATPHGNAAGAGEPTLCVHADNEPGAACAAPVQWMAAEPSPTSQAVRTAEDVMQRLAQARDDAAAAQQSDEAQRRREAHRRRYGLPYDDADDASNAETKESAAATRRVLCFDDDKLDALNTVFRRWHEHPASRPSAHDDCVMIYTSGTTARPKGAVHSHASVTNTVRVLAEAWQWSEEDSILSLLPTHHIHGLFNIIFCALAAGARCVSTNFDNPARIARRLSEGDITLFMAVPTVYTKLIEAVERQFSPVEQTAFRKACEAHVRLMVSGSAALPVPTLERFRALSGHTLLERYGMTETGMILSQPLHPVSQRVPGTVGRPLPHVRTWVMQSATPHGPGDTEAMEKAEEKQGSTRRGEEYDAVGQLAVASDSLFDRYWNNPAGTRSELRERAVDGARFFDTGDTVGVCHDEGGNGGGVYTIMGRSSVDIIKSSGYKLSALEIEAILLRRKDIFQEVAVVGMRDDCLGEAVVAIVALQPDVVAAQHVQYDAQTHMCESEELRAELHRIASEILAPYKCPRRYICMPAIPHNATGKVNKKQLKKLIGLT